MSKSAVAPVDVADRERVNVAIGRMLLFGHGADQVAGGLGMDYETARKRIAEVKGEWASELADPQALRGLLAGMAWAVWQDATTWAREGMERQRGSLLRVAVSSIQAMLDISGLRTLRVDVGSSQLAGLLAAMAGGAAVGLAALESGQRETIAGEWREVGQDESGGGASGDGGSET